MAEKLKELFFKIVEIIVVFGFGWHFSKVVNASLTEIEVIVFILSAVATCCVIQKKYNNIFLDETEQEKIDE